MTPGPDVRQARWSEPTLFDLDVGPGRAKKAASTADTGIPAALRRETIGVPTLPRLRVVRHFTRLAQETFSIDTGSYPLGSCTMKYNPKTAELAAHDAAAGWVHPLQPSEQVQGTLSALHELQQTLKAVSGMDEVSLAPAAGAQGEWAAMVMVRHLFRDRGEARREVIVPDSAHGTNPASAAMAGFDVVEIPSGADGCVDLKALETALSDRTAAFMLTNPNTLGVFESNVERIAGLVHDAGAVLYYDGANLNAIMGVTNPGAMGFDVVHFNLHKTFATPHGGGGPGAGPVGARGPLAQYLPAPLVVQAGGGFELGQPARSIGPVKGFHGNVGVLIRALAYAGLNGGDGLARATRTAVANANYVHRRIRDLYPSPGRDVKKHEFVVSCQRLADERGVRAMDVAKRLLDHGIHSPTVYFPLIVPECMMIEPTETETKEELDALVDALRQIAGEDPDTVRSAPHSTTVSRVDEVRAARQPVLTWDQAKRGGAA